MNTQSSAMPESFDSPKAAPAAVSQPHPFYWSVRRELWENRFLYAAPFVVGGVFLVGFFISLGHLPSRMRAASALSLEQQRAALFAHYEIMGGVMMFTAILVSMFYCLDALYGERRDRSIVFWKSLPVSDLTTVLAKVSVPLVIVPVIASAVGSALQLIMMLMSSVVLAASGLSVAALWSELPWFKMSLLLLYHILTAHALWPAPLYGWMLVVSGWARRATFIWASLPVLAIAGVEAIAFRTSHFLNFVGGRFIGYAPENMDVVFPTNPMAHVTPGVFFSSPGLWGGLAVTAIFVAIAVSLRRRQGPI